ncbi:DUF6011 domain-containing protein [Streptomyces griseoluteus]|uniref:DUF6011 domain-containing protein n=1 Tax=Streptomyces griseoluteus TaxID=29306 RepID=UPI00341DD06C
MKCRYCPRALRTPESRARGYGPVCGRQHGLLPASTPRQRAVTTPVTGVRTPALPGHIHPDQTAIPIQPVIPLEE